VNRELAWALEAAYASKAGQPSRTIAIVITRLEEAVLWMGAGEALDQTGEHAILDMAKGIL
jgi:hypothetical protein